MAAARDQIQTRTTGTTMSPRHRRRWFPFPSCSLSSVAASPGHGGTTRMVASVASLSCSWCVASSRSESGGSLQTCVARHPSRSPWPVWTGHACQRRSSRVVCRLVGRHASVTGATARGEWRSERGGQGGLQKGTPRRGRRGSSARWAGVPGPCRGRRALRELLRFGHHGTIHLRLPGELRPPRPGPLHRHHRRLR